MILADRHTRHFGAGKFQIDGHQVNLIAIQKSKRTTRAGRTNYIYKCRDTLLYNWNPNTYAWSTFGDHISHRGVKYDAADFIILQTPEAKEFRELNGYELV